jgi:Protein of unknown function (DUF3485)
MPSRLLISLSACALLALSGIVHGIWTDRWQSSQPLLAACARVADVPADAGPWKSTDLEADPEAYEQARANAFWLRNYTKAGSNESFTVILMCGRADHMSVHTPDICYRGAGYEMVGEQTKTNFEVGQNGTKSEWWTARFRQPPHLASTLGSGKPGSKVARELRIFWTWSVNGSWRAPSSPRWTFAAEPYLYKLYVVHASTGNSSRDSAAVDFLEQLLPTLEKSLFAAS